MYNFCRYLSVAGGGGGVGVVLGVVIRTCVIMRPVSGDSILWVIPSAYPTSLQRQSRLAENASDNSRCETGPVGERHSKLRSSPKELSVAGEKIPTASTRLKPLSLNEAAGRCKDKTLDGKGRFSVRIHQIRTLGTYYSCAGNAGRKNP